MDTRKTPAFGQLLRTFRLAAGLSQEELAERAGLSLRGVSDLERGVRQIPRMETVRMLAEALGFDPSGPEWASLLASRNTAGVPGAEPRRPDLPVPSSPLIGRERDLARISETFGGEDVRLLTVVGPGGVGKTRLALAVAARMANDLPDRVCFTDLTPVRDPDLVLQAIASALGVRDTGPRPLVDAIEATIGEKETVLVLDNLEHLVQAVPEIADLIGACPALRILATSRVPLRLSAEHVYTLEPLDLPDPERSSTLTDLARSPSIALFVARARAADAEFALTDANAGAVDTLVRRLEGLPLAIELAAARVRTLPPKALLDRLERQLPLLSGGVRDAPPRQRTMRDTIAWSYDLLSVTEQQFFRYLAVFMGGFDLEAFEVVCGDLTTPDLDPLSALTSLVDKSLVRVVDSPAGSPRYLMLETIREFAEEQLIASGEEEVARQHHAVWCVDFSNGAPAALLYGSDATDLARVEAEHANVQSALRWAEASGDAMTLLRLVFRLGMFWYMTGREPEGLEWHRRALASVDDDRSFEYIETTIRTGHLAHRLNDPTASSYLERAQELARAAGDIGLQTSAALVLGIMAEDRGDYEAADVHLASGEELARHAGLQWAQAVARYHFGVIAYGRGEREEARAILNDAREMALTIEDLLLPIWIDAYLILIACEEGELDQAASLLRGAHRIQQKSNFLSSDSTLLGAAGVFACALHEWDAGARLLGFAAAEIHDVPFSLPERIPLSAAEDLARQHLGGDAYADARQQGHQMRREAFVAEVDHLLAILDSGRTDGVEENASPLTPREHEVLRLLIEGKSNREIADALFISPRTATTHVTHILAKLGVESRAAAISYAFQHDLA